MGWGFGNPMRYRSAYLRRGRSAPLNSRRRKCRIELPVNEVLAIGIVSSVRLIWGLL